MDATAKADELLRLHHAPELLTLVNVWDVASATVVASVPETTALATASHSIAAAYGYRDGELAPETMFEAMGRIAAATSLPVSADLEAGYGDTAETVRRAIDVGIVGGNIEDEMRPLRESVAAVESAVAAAEDRGVRFVLNARTDAYLIADDRDPSEKLADAITRGCAYLDAGAACVFVPGLLDEPTVSALVEAYGRGRLSVLGVPGSLAPDTLRRLGVARLSYGPWSMRHAYTALRDLTAELLTGAALPDSARQVV